MEWFTLPLPAFSFFLHWLTTYLSGSLTFSDTARDSDPRRKDLKTLYLSGRSAAEQMSMPNNSRSSSNISASSSWHKSFISLVEDWSPVTELMNAGPEVRRLRLCKARSHFTQALTCIPHFVRLTQWRRWCRMWFSPFTWSSNGMTTQSTRFSLNSIRPGKSTINPSGLRRDRT